MAILSIVFGIAGIWFLTVTIPGPNFIMVTQKSMSESRKSGLFIALGVSTAASVWATSSLLGLKAVFEYAYWLYDTIKIIGGIYIVWMGLKLIFSASSSADLEVGNGGISESFFKDFRKGMLTSFSNPKTAAFFSSIFVTAFPPQAPAWAYYTTICMVFTVSMLWYSSVALFFSLPRVREGYRKCQSTVNRITGILLITLGIRLAFSRS